MNRCNELVAGPGRGRPLITTKRAKEQLAVPLPSIQVLRAVAALAVLFGHLGPSLYEFGYDPNLIPAFDFGAAGVDLFFVISGFIMVYTSERLFAERGASRSFFSRRVIRIVPLYWALTTLAIFGWHGLTLPAHLTWPNVIGSYFLVPTTRPTGGEAPELVQAWTLYYEMLFYVLFAVVIVLPRHFAVIALSVIFLVIVSAAQMIGPELGVPWKIWAVPITYEFVFGMWIALAFRAGWRLHPAVCCAVTLSALIFMVAAQQYDLVNLRPLTFTYSRPLVWGIGAALVVASFALADVTRPLPALLKPIVVIGDASYALYLFHTFVPFGFQAVHVPRIIDPLTHPFAYSGLTAAIAIIGALLINVLDGRSRRWLLEKTHLRRASMPLAPTVN
jgi:peptidoglycan/LPS O-acetylase OafA/YrhL